MVEASTDMSNQSQHISVADQVENINGSIADNVSNIINTEGPNQSTLPNDEIASTATIPQTKPTTTNVLGQDMTATQNSPNTVGKVTTTDITSSVTEKTTSFSEASGVAIVSKASDPSGEEITESVGAAGELSTHSKTKVTESYSKLQTMVNPTVVRMAETSTPVHNSTFRTIDMTTAESGPKIWQKEWWTRGSLDKRRVSLTALLAIGMVMASVIAIWLLTMCIRCCKARRKMKNGYQRLST